MKIFVLCLLLCFFTLPVAAYSTKASEFAAKQYETQNKCKVHINSKKEHTLCCRQFVGSTYVETITYGYGDITIKEKFLKNKKCRITYSVLFNSENKPVWSSIYRSKQ